MHLEVILYLLRTSILVTLIVLPSLCFSQKKFTTGAKVEDAFYDSLPLLDESFRGSIPKSYSLKKFAGKPGNQLKYKHSTAWAVSGAATILESIGYGRTDAGETTRNMKSPYFVNMLFVDSLDVCNDEISLATALHLVSVYGLPNLLEYIDICPSKTSQKALDKAKKSNFYTYKKIIERGDQESEKLKRIKSKLILDKPIVISMHCPYSFQIAKESWQPTELFNAEMPLQSMIIVGFDDEKHGGAFEVLNSWGSDWGNGGYMWVPYKEIQFFRYVFSMETKYSGDEPLSYTGEFSLNLSDSTIIPIEPGKQKGIFYPSIESDNFEFQINGTSNKPVYIKVYYKGVNGEVVPIYPSSNWRSALVEHTFRNYKLPDENNFYTISDESYFKLYLFISPGDITKTDFTSLVATSENTLDIITNGEFEFGKNVVWTSGQVEYFARLQPSNIIPVIFEFDLNRSVD